MVLSHNKFILNNSDQIYKKIAYRPSNMLSSKYIFFIYIF